MSFIDDLIKRKEFQDKPLVLIDIGALGFLHPHSFALELAYIGQQKFKAPIFKKLEKKSLASIKLLKYKIIFRLPFIIARKCFEFFKLK